MRILLAHDYYRSSAPSGEDAVFRNERALLEKYGVEVIPFERFNDDIDDSSLTKRLRLGLEGAWSNRTYEELSDVIRRTRPHLAHFHNTFPLLSPSAYAACQDNAVPVVQTLHNYRLICAGALLTRDGHPCEDCVGTSLLPALRYRCYRGSLPATGAVVWMLASNRARGAYRTLVNRYIALTRFAAGRLMAGGLPENRMEVKPNFLPNAPEMGLGDGNYAVFVGRLSEEKGLRTLLEAWRHVDGFPLKIMGDGPLRHELEGQARRDGLSVEFLGFRPRENVLQMVGGADVQVVPSECYEGFPMVVLEAYACGTPILASRIGSLDEIVLEGETGMKFEPGNPDDLVKKLNLLRSDSSRLHAMRLTARALFEENYTADRNYHRLLEIYRRARVDFDETTARNR
jgi:glycosyltransferase involved in cell wall biosynthesis